MSTDPQKQVCLKIDLAKLRQRLSAQQGRTLTESDVHYWLNAAGFHLRDAWYCDHGSIASLRPEEVLEHSVLVTDNGITFFQTHRLCPPPPPSAR